jgi:hypothetical protein
MTMKAFVWGWAASLGFLVACSSGNSTNSDAGIDAATPDAGHAIGESCKNGNSDCMTGLQCAGEDPNGQCIKLCTPSMDSTCGDTTKYACSFEGHCYAKCNTTADCPRASEGYACKDDQPARGVKFCDAAN